MTASDFLQEHLEISHFYNDKYNKMCCLSSDVQKAMKEYAKLKCQELLLSVAEKADEAYVGGWDLDRDEVLTVVDLDSFIEGTLSF